MIYGHIAFLLDDDFRFAAEEDFEFEWDEEVCCFGGGGFVGFEEGGVGFISGWMLVLSITTVT